MRARTAARRHRPVFATAPDRQRRLARAIDDIRERFRVVLIDTPPSLGLLTLNALVAADSVLVPLQCEYLALEGLAKPWTRQRALPAIPAESFRTQWKKSARGRRRERPDGTLPRGACVEARPCRDRGYAAVAGCQSARL